MVQIVVMARWPSPGRCKRRLSRDLNHELGLANSSERATRIQRRLTQHTAAVVRDLAGAMEIEPVLAVSGLGPRAATRWGQLGTRLRRQLMHGHRHNRPCLVIGTDLPELNPDDLRQAVERLKQHDLVLGPASDGGYWLLGIGASLIRSPQLWPLIGIPWGGPRVLEATLEAARRRQLSSALVAQRNDLDHWSDLMPWQG